MFNYSTCSGVSICGVKGHYIQKTHLLLYEIPLMMHSVTALLSVTQLLHPPAVLPCTCRGLSCGSLIPPGVPLKTRPLQLEYWVPMMSQYGE